tara:strand:+ start:21859 stop:22734 length:876 start_codon:yes stop_codon:yes gene_type:complete
MKIYKLLFLPVFLLIIFGCSSNEKQVDQADINIRILASDIGVGKARLPFILSDKNNNPIYDIKNKISIEYCHEETCLQKNLQEEVEWREWPIKGGIYTTYLTFNQPGFWKIYLSYIKDGKNYNGEAAILVKSNTEAPNVGDLAPLTVNKTATSIEQIKKISSAINPDSRLYANNLVDSLNNKRPIILSFSTPGFCFTKTCGPQVEVLSRLADKYSNIIDFIHVEIFENPDEMLLNGDYSIGIQSEIVYLWELATEPWTFYIDENGIIVERFEGFANMDEIEESIITSPIFQ